MLEKTYFTEDLAKELRLSPRTVEKWRRTGRGPRFMRVGKVVMYREGDIIDWMAGVTLDPVERQKIDAVE